MILVDTSIWISFLRRDDQDTYDILKKYLSKNQICTISAVFGELLQGARNERERNLLHLLWSGLPKLPEEGLFIKAGELSNKHQLHQKGVGLIDCYILSAALSYDSALWTLDKKLLAAFDQLASA